MFITYLSFLIYIHCNPNISVTITKLNKHFYTCLFTCGIFVSSFATQPWRARGIYFQCMTPHFSSWSQSHQIEIVSVFKHQGYKCACLCMIFTFSIQATWNGCSLSCSRKILSPLIWIPSPLTFIKIVRYFIFSISNIQLLFMFSWYFPTAFKHVWVLFHFEKTKQNRQPQTTSSFHPIFSSGFHLSLSSLFWQVSWAVNTSYLYFPCLPWLILNSRDLVSVLIMPRSTISFWYNKVSLDLSSAFHSSNRLRIVAVMANSVSTWLGQRVPRYLVKNYSGCFYEVVFAWN